CTEMTRTVGPTFKKVESPMKSWRMIVSVTAAVACVSAVLVAQQVIDPAKLPEPTQAKPNQGRIVPKPDDAKLTVPAGFTVDTYADNVAGARIMTFAPNGDLFVAQSSQNAIMILRDTKKAGLPDERFTYAQGAAAGRGRGGPGAGAPGAGPGAPCRRA